MANERKKTARYKILADRAGNRYQFFCDVSGALLCTSEPLLLDSPEAELELAWESEGKREFNLCHKCGKWVSDAVYNPETLECVECSPWEEIPAYCPHCGEKAESGAVFCDKCKNRLRYGNGEDNTAENDYITDCGLFVGGVNHNCRLRGGLIVEKRRENQISDPDEYGFGVKVMKRTKVCGKCGSTEDARSYICSKCGKRLPVQTLFQIYQQKHKRCELCDTVLASYMSYCPRCGKQVQ